MGIARFPSESSPRHDNPEDRPVAERVKGLLREVDEVDEALSKEEVARVRRGLVERRQALALSLLDLLQEWRSTGGLVRLDLPSARAAPITEIHVRSIEPRDHRSTGAPGVDAQALLLSVLESVVFSEDDELEINRLHAAIRESDRWRALPRELQRGVVALLTARLRRLQDDQRLIHPRLEESFSLLTAYSKREQPGYVVGLSRHHQPVRGSWVEDAKAWWDRLSAPLAADTSAPEPDRLVEGVTAAVAAWSAAEGEEKEAAGTAVRAAIRDALSGGVLARDPRLVAAATPVADLLDGLAFRLLKRAIKEATEPPAPAEDPEALPADWPGLKHTRARRAILIGGEPKDPLRLRLQREFGFSELEWLGSETRRSSLMVVRDRIRTGRVDLVIVVTPAIAEDVDAILVPVCRERAVDVVHSAEGPGLPQIRAAIERALPA